MNAKKLVTCKKCGRNDLQWKQSKAGKWYLTYDEGAHIVGESGRTIKILYPAHQCLVRDGELSEKRCALILRGLITTTDEERAEAEAMEQAKIDAYYAKTGIRVESWHF